MSATLAISARPCEYGGGFIKVKYDLTKPGYRKVVEITSLAEVELAVRSARHENAGADMSMTAFIVRGRKPNGFDKWQAANRHLLEIHKEGAP